jgi:uncharacterized FAD-dependent dehydrogenase
LRQAWEIQLSDYDVIIIGAGPAGIFSALELTRKDNLNVLILEKGRDIDKRQCPAREGKCILCSPCSITSGWGGAGAFSDGKLTLSTEVGGWLSEYVSENTLRGLVDYVDGIYQEYGAPDTTYGADALKTRALKQQARMAGLTLIASPIKHLGTDKCFNILKVMREDISERVQIRTGVTVEKILTEDNQRATGVLTSNGDKLSARYIIAAPGREGADWLASEARRLELGLRNNAVDIGLRVEVPAAVMAPLTRDLYEPKLLYCSHYFKDQIRTFCVNPNGLVSTETYGDVITVNGHSYADRKTTNTNFALLVSTSFTEPFKEPIAYGKYIARLANLLGEGILVQRLGDLQAGRRSTEERIEEGFVKPTMPSATPGDLSFVLPFRYISDILEMIEALDQMAPGVNSRNTLLYGVEVKFYSSRVKLSSKLETEIRNLYAIGDGAGITRGLVQSSCSGVIAARAILEDAGVGGKKQEASLVSTDEPQ